MSLKLKGSGLAVAGVKGHSRRLVATALAIAIGVAFVVSSLLILDGATQGIRDGWSEGVDEHDLIVTAGTQDADLMVADALRERDDVASVEASAVQWTEDAAGRFAPLVLPSSFDRIELIDGRMPEGAAEVAVTSLYANAAGVGVGDTVEMALPRDEAGTEATTGADEPDEPEIVAFEVVGTLELTGSPMYVGADALVVSEQGARTHLSDHAFRDLRVDLEPGADAAAVTDAVLATGAGSAPDAGSDGEAYTVRSGAAEAEYRSMMVMNDTDYLRMILLGFGAVGLLTTVLVIANTFRIVLAQRSQELALLRCLGATRGQVRRSALAEAGLLGALASAAGVAIGAGLTAAVLAILPPIDIFGGGAIALTVSLPALLGPWVVGVLITLAAAWWPTRSASRVDPIHGLHAPSEPSSGRSAGRGRTIASLTLLGLGALGLVAGAMMRSVPIGLLGGGVSFIGLLVAGSLIVPGMVRALGAPARATGVPGDIAVRSALSNPGRAAATSAALIIGVALITMTSVGAATAERTVMSEIDQRRALDVIAEAPAESSRSADAAQREELIGRATIEATRGVSGVADVLALRGSPIQVPTANQETGDATFSAYSFDPEELAPLLRDPAAAQPLTDGTLGAPGAWLETFGLQPGERIEITGPAGGAEVQVVELQGLGEWTVFIAPDVLETIDPEAPVTALAVGLEEDLEGSALGTTVSDIRSAGNVDDLFLSGGAIERAELTSAVAAIVLVVTGLLGVAVLIALVGIANTLSLSVLERGRENALLRALGLTRGQLRTMLAGEGVLLALAGTVIGMVAGGVYAWFGVVTLFPETATVQLDLPWLSLGLIAVIAVTAGVLASVLPARRAARTAPAAGLAAW